MIPATDSLLCLNMLHCFAKEHYNHKIAMKKNTLSVITLYPYISADVIQYNIMPYLS
jgi:hypothetical protein